MVWCVVMAKHMSVILVMSKLTGVNDDAKVVRHATATTESYDTG